MGTLLIKKGDIRGQNTERSVHWLSGSSLAITVNSSVLHTAL